MPFVWKKASDMMENVQVIVEGVTPSDIFQGSLGDCYMLSSLSALAEFPERIERLLINKAANNKGVYSVALNINGDWKLMHLDDLFPTNARRIYFSHTKSAELWAMLLEKAYARAYKGYWNIGTGGFAEDALKDLTGAPTEFGSINEKTDVAELWNKFSFADKKKYCMVVGSKGQGEHKSELGIITGHAYTVMGAHFIGDQKVHF
jgi:Calpain family cysteine protease